jgi:hypothetical protein
VWLCSAQLVVTSIHSVYLYQKSDSSLVFEFLLVWVDIATLGPSWNFSLAENLASLSLQDGPQSGIIS